MQITAEFPEKLGFLMQPWRYKVAYGGRGSGKSWGFARALLIRGVAEKTRVLCTREIQKSIKDSVHKLLSDQIQLLGLGAFYTVLDTEIRGKNGTEFTFTGLSQHTVESIKSYEGVDIAWCEEAHAITKRSWDVLIPTIRKPGSEIWISFNPELETDPTYQRFVVSPPADTMAVHVNYSDNPFFNDVMEAERAHCEKTSPDDYPNIWLGECRPAVEGAIYYKEIQQAEAEGRICNVPYDPLLKVHVVFDLGWNDLMTISLVQKHMSEIRIIDYIEDSHRTLDDYSAELKAKRFNWGRVWLPHDGYSKDFKTGKSTAAILRRLGWDVPRRDEITEISIEEGIKLTRMTFNRFCFNKPKTERLVECAKRYRRRITRETQEAGSPLHDEFSHGADNLRYITVNSDNFNNYDERPPVQYVTGYYPRDPGVGI